MYFCTLKMCKRIFCFCYGGVCSNRTMILPKTIRTAIKIQNRKTNKQTNRISWTRSVEKNMPAIGNQADVIKQ